MFSNVTVNKLATLTLVLAIGAVLLAPLVYNSSFAFPFVVPKSVLFRIASIVAFVAWVVLAMVNLSYRPVRRVDARNLVAILAVVWLGVNIAAAFMGANQTRSIMGTLERMGGVTQIFFTLIFFLSVLYGVRDSKTWNSLITLCVAGGSIAVLSGFGQYVGVIMGADAGGVRLGGSAGNPIFFASYLVLNLFFTCYLLFDQKRMQPRVLVGTLLGVDVFLALSSVFNAGVVTDRFFFFELFRSGIAVQVFSNAVLVAILLFIHGGAVVAWRLRRPLFMQLWLLSLIVLNIFIVIQTQARGPVLGLLIGIIVSCFAAVVSTSSTTVKKIALASLGCVMVLFVGGYAVRNSSFVQSEPTLRRLVSVSLTDITVESRILVWQAAWEGITANVRHLLIGAGPENFYTIFDARYPIGIYKDTGSPQFFDRAHNIIIDTIASTGIVGLASYGALIVAAMWFGMHGARKRQPGAWLLPGFFAAYVTQALFAFDTINTDVLLFFAIALTVTGGEVQGTDRVSLRSPKAVPLIMVLMVAVACIGAQGRILFAAERISFADSDSSASGSVYDANKAETLLAIAQRPYPVGFEARLVLAEYAAAVADEDIDVFGKMDFLNSARQVLETGVLYEPMNVELRFSLGKFYNSFSRLDHFSAAKNVSLMRETVVLSPTRPSAYFELGRALAIAGEVDEGLKVFRDGVELAPGVADSQWSLLTFCILIKQFDCANQSYAVLREIQVARDSGPFAYWDQWPKLVDAYVAIEQWDKAIEFQLKTIETNPSGLTGDEYSRLAALYQKAGNAALAREAASRAMEINPSLAPAAQAFIDSLE